MDHLHPWLDEQGESNIGTDSIMVNITPGVENELVGSPEDKGRTSDVLADYDVSSPRFSP